jgi:hypothetical protein
MDTGREGWIRRRAPADESAGVVSEPGWGLVRIEEDGRIPVEAQSGEQHGEILTVNSENQSLQSLRGL